MKTNTKKILSTNSTINSSKTIGVSDEVIRQRAYQINLQTGNSDEQDNWDEAKLELTGKK